MRALMVNLLLAFSISFPAVVGAAGDGVLAPGRRGSAFIGSPTPPMVWLEATESEPFATLPITVEGWVKLDDAAAFNVIAACQAKESKSHWEVMTQAGTGKLAVFRPGATPDTLASEESITDRKWHYVAAVIEPSRVMLFVDGHPAGESAVDPKPDRKVVPGAFSIGYAAAKRNPGDAHGCAGLIDELRISRGVRQIAVPDAPMSVDGDTIGLWTFDSIANGHVQDQSKSGASLKLVRLEHKSLDDIDRESFAAGPGPRSAAAIEVKLSTHPVVHPAAAPALNLDGDWQLAEGGDEKQRLNGDWSDSIRVRVPGSVHLALERAGKIPDPKFARNDALAREKSFKTWWYRTNFNRPANFERPRLIFDGVAIKCTVWLNGTRLGSHEGMFGGPEFDVGDALADDNTLIVKIEPAPNVKGEGQPNDFFRGMNVGWLYTVVFNNVYGWHYSNIPSLGIWRSVRLESQPAVSIGRPFVATADAHAGLIDIVVDHTGPTAGWSGRLIGTIAPENFEGAPIHFEQPVQSAKAELRTRLRLAVPNPKLWWPNDIGQQNLYRLQLSFAPDGNGMADAKSTTFGIRTIEMAPLPSGPNPRLYNWTFVINGRPTFVKGTGWCTMDSSMDFRRERYARLIDLAKLQHVQMLRAWGSGMPETDDFYDLCDRAGIMVMQEWPTAWNSHREGWQPYEILEETVRLNTLRLRNHPSLAMWGAGNESDDPFGKAIDMMGRLALELDGTRPFHRGEPWGGSVHNYDCDWGRKPLDHAFSLQSIFFGEFGMRSMPDFESVQRYLPDDEKSLWPPREDGAFAYHTPVFNTKEDMSRLRQFSGYFSAGENMRDFIFGSQLAATTCVRHTLERARTRWPEATGALYYKMNDNYPAASWACVDWYGAPKMNHYFFQSAFAPLHAVLLLDSFDVAGKQVAWPVHLIDDVDALGSAPWQVNVRAYDSALKLVKEQSFDGVGSIERTKKVGQFELDSSQTASTPLLIRIAVTQSGKLVDSTFYWLNFQAVKDSLTRLPPTTLRMAVGEGQVTVTNSGNVPAVGVSVQRARHLDSFTASENYIWLEPGETRTIRVNSTEGIEAKAWNN